MPWPTKCELQDAAVKVLDAFEVLAESLVREILAHAGLDPDGAAFAHHCRPAARRAGLAGTEIDSSPLVNPQHLLSKHCPRTARTFLVTFQNID